LIEAATLIMIFLYVPGPILPYRVLEGEWLRRACQHQLLGRLHWASLRGNRVQDPGLEPNFAGLTSALNRAGY